MHALKGKKALITGGTAGIGKAIAHLFVQQGADVMICGTDSKKAELTIQELQSDRLSSEQKIESHLLDVSKKSQVQTCIESLLSTWSSVDILVNNAGITRDQLLMKMSEEDWDRVLEVNLKSVYNTCHALVRPMMKARSGSIINITSIIGLTGNAGQTNYAASKAGMIGFSKSLAKEVASRGIRVNCVAPGYIDTHMTEKLSPQIKETFLSKIPLGRIGQPSDIAQAVLFLASDASSYITGQVLTVDGGMVL